MNKCTRGMPGLNLLAKDHVDARVVVFLTDERDDFSVEEGELFCGEGADVVEVEF